MRTALLAPALSLAILGSAPASAAPLCDELWGERNAVYAEAGYCFRTPRGIQAFGNAGCRFDEIRDVPLSARDRQKVSAIVREKQRSGCRE
ncbi:YARHG domain-containing protein [Methylobacterium planeticum]|uniref:YARHG domain-containing protein n=1 Tax=Methylobacterium planeticum TaxID=2615211 RepID=A0A6N6MJA1_9HYPH|nr:YARHG domain-containing protein [Methylobacterium planeticum]KAB1071205.1 YARHG domain-containing protein [Methylobacterium planeticum]